MPTYVSLINWTDEGIKNFRDTTKRAKSFTKLVAKNGGKVRELLWTIGEFDLVAVVDFPDEESSVATLLQLCSLGNVRTRTMRAFGAKEMDGILSRVG
ncbi:MAG TPA: GYD domain-containing protein [Acidimicrobiales bacterium]|nr:GYD domain-containing protein [Acidimicrobiales bacterium]